MIDSKKGNEMYLSVSPIYEQNEIIKSIFEAIGSEADNSIELADDILLQFFPQTATWGLDIWEQRLGLVTNYNETIERRRGMVLAKLQSNYSITPERMAYVIKSYTGVDTLIIEDVSPYVFRVEMAAKDVKLSVFTDIINKIKPSHLGYEFSLNCNSVLNFKADYKEYSYSFLSCGTFQCGTKPDINNLANKVAAEIKTDINNTDIKQKYNMAGTFSIGGDAI